MIRILGEDSLSDYSSNTDFVYSLCPGMSNGELLADLVLSSAAVSILEKAKTPDEKKVMWEAVSGIEKRRMKGSSSISYLHLLSEAGNNVNLVCKCREKDYCVRSIVYDLLLERGTEVFIG